MAMAAGTLLPGVRSRPRLRLIRRRPTGAQRPAIRTVHVAQAPAPASGRDTLVRAAYAELADLARLHAETRERRATSAAADPMLLDDAHREGLVTSACSYCRTT